MPGPIFLLLVLTVLAFILWGACINILWDNGRPMNSLGGSLAVIFGVAWVAGMALLGAFTILQPQWEAVYIPVTQENARFGLFVGIINAVLWFGPQVTGALFLFGAWWVWKRLVRDHFYYVRDTRWNKSAN